MRSIAVTIFLSFWFVFAVLIATFAVMPNQGAGVRFADHVQQDGLVASTLFERHGAAACDEFLALVEQQKAVHLALFDGAGAALCHSPGSDPAALAAVLPAPAAPDRRPDDETLTHAAVRGPSGAAFFIAAQRLPRFNAMPVRPPFPVAPVSVAILVSGVVCFALARYLMRPLQQVRDTSYRLAAGDLQARAGPQVGARRDEVGDLVRDFDAMAGRLEALVHSQGQLLSDISHELRSPLARLNVALALARRKAGAAATPDLDRIEIEAERMNELIGRVLALARAENGAGGPERARVALDTIVHDVVEDARYEAEQQQKTVALTVAAGPILVGDAQLIASAVDNIVRNAVRYAPAQSQVEVEVTHADGAAVVTVRDHGPGVPPAELERIFSPFHRVETARTPDTGGVGLGLAIARRAVTVHGGTIRAENAVGGGLRVTVRLPDTSLPDLDQS